MSENRRSILFYCEDSTITWPLVVTLYLVGRVAWTTRGRQQGNTFPRVHLQEASLSRHSSAWEGSGTSTAPLIVHPLRR